MISLSMHPRVLNSGPLIALVRVQLLISFTTFHACQEIDVDGEMEAMRGM